MDIRELLAVYAANPQINAVNALTEKNTLLKGLAGSAAAMTIASLFSKRRRNYLCILNDLEEAGYFYNDLMQLLDDKQVFFFPSAYNRHIKYGHNDPANEILRTEVLSLLQNEQSAQIIVSYPDALAEKVLSKKELLLNTLKISVNEKVDNMFVSDVLDSLGFEQTDYVYEPGQYAMRGSIVDIFSFSNEYPYRVDFFGNEVETIRTFDVETQLSKEKLTSINIIPDISRSKSADVSLFELLPSQTVIVTQDLAWCIERVGSLWEEEPVKGDEGSFASAEAMQQRLVRKDDFFRSVRSFSLMQIGNKDALQQTLLIETSPCPLRRGTVRTYPPLEGAGGGENAPVINNITKEPTIPPSRHCGLDPQSPFFAEIAGQARNDGTLPILPSHSTATIPFDNSPQPLFHKNFDMVSESLRRFLSEGYTLYLLSDNEKQTDRIRDIFRDRGDDIPFHAVNKTLHSGFVDNELKICIFTDHQIFGRYHKYNLKSDKARSGKMMLSLKELNQFSHGDYIVHIDHGIGRFGGLIRTDVNGKIQEAVKLIYRNNDIIFVSIHALHKLSKYKGKDGEPPALSKLGSGAWERMKERTKKKVKDIARDLIRLYSQRLTEKGFAYSPDSFMQDELEACFIYEDTPDQVKATSDVKADMENERPMDRLICGDVGFGKTEVAIRAAFKAVADNKQVAVLVPTTVLAFQHYKTFSDRLKDFPCTIDYLSRARSAGDAKKILARLQAGELNILIGTHRIVSKDVIFKDLGLLVIDEEQKFGVSVKEKLRQLKINVDTLTMTATPIPRTLQFSLMGARDLSNIHTPPPNRYPIHTETQRFNPDIIREAISFEMSRNGQVFFVHNRIQNIHEIERLIRREVPDARIAVGHGQMDPEKLENIILDFVDYEYDVLVSTTIIENGLDIPNANTIIVNNAHHFGLSDLHQLRGRVGRSNRKAFCYLLSPPLSALTPEARRRLQAIENFAELGSGIHIAMQDLDIRGAGNMLGAEQSGFIADLGYEAYQKILEEAVGELKAEEFADLFHLVDKKDDSGETYIRETFIESDLELMFPPTYIPNDSERISLYRELDSVENETKLSEFITQLKDRFGAIPTEGEELIRIVQLRWLANKLGIEKIVLKQGKMAMYLPSNPESPYYLGRTFGKILTYIQRYPRNCELREQSNRRSIILKQVTNVATACRCLEEMQRSI